MGSNPIRCYIGFSTENVSPLTAELEEHGASMERRFRKADANLLAGLSVLHDAVDAAIDGDRDGVDRMLDRCLSRLDACNLDLASIGEGLARSRQRLAEVGQSRPGEPLVKRERFFRDLDYEAVYRELLAAGGALPGKVFWEEVVDAVRGGGAAAGLRLLEKTLRRVQTAVRSYANEAAHMRDRPLAELASGLHGMSTGVAAILVQWHRLVVVATYLSVVCERATVELEAEERGERAAGLARGA